MDRDPPLRKIDAVTVPVPDLDAGLAFCSNALGHRLRWRNDELGQAGLGLPEGDNEIVLATGLGYEPNWLVKSADAAAARVREAGGRVLHEPSDIPVGRLAVAADPSATSSSCSICRRAATRPTKRGGSPASSAAGQGRERPVGSRGAFPG